jgi:hypothetical protein
LSPLVEFLIDLVTSGLGGVGRKPHAPFPEGEANASLGAVAAFVGLLTGIFAFGLLMIISYGSGLSVSDYSDLIGASSAVALLACAGRWAGARAPSVTRRHLGLAQFGRGAATLALGMSFVAVLVGVFDLVRHVA